MNHLGVIVQKYISKRDTVLDIGCGIMQSTMDTIKTQTPHKDLKCRAVLGVDAFIPYLESLKNRPNVMVMKANIISDNFWDQFLPDSFDIVMALDILEHLEKSNAFELISQCERVARKCVLLYTPIKFYDNKVNTDGVKEYGINEPNPLQEHRCLIERSYFDNNGYKTKIIMDEGVLAVKNYG